MAQHPGLQQVQRLSLQQTLSPQLQQSLHLLQVPALELNQLVHEELQQNPLLEELPKDEPPRLESKVDKKTETGDVEFDKEFETLAKLDDEWRDNYRQANSVRRRSAEQDEQRQRFFDSILQTESLQQHLLSQLDLTSDERKVAEYVIGNINDDGYLLTPIEELSISDGIPLAQLQGALDLVQSFHPVGVGARNLRECLLIQLHRLGKADSIEAKVVGEYLDELGRKHYPEIARLLGLTVEQVQAIADFIATLEPKPGRMFSAEQQQYVAADVTVQTDEDGYTILLNDDQIPHLRISEVYKELMAGGEKTAEVRNYIREKINAGKFLIKSIQQRQETIENIAKVIVDRQREFLDKGIAHLKPLTMAEVAQVVGVHETTVSRAVANKYIQTPQGLFEMRYFFTSGFATATGGTLSNTSVKDQLAQLVAHENSNQPLSDQKLVALLKEKGIPIARRTIAKYRGELNILPSNLRKKF
ncbi:MAG: RNA polymerase factor sigma-54 [Verrucomicrobiota bacterium]